MVNRIPAIPTDTSTHIRFIPPQIMDTRPNKTPTNGMNDAAPNAIPEAGNARPKGGSARPKAGDAIPEGGNAIPNRERGYPVVRTWANLVIDHQT